MNKKTAFLTGVTLTAALFAVYGDEVRTSDDSVIHGTVKALDGDKLTIETKLFGTLTVSRDQITGFTIDNPVSVRLDDDSVQIGSLNSRAPERVDINGEHADASVELSRIQELWPKDAEDPRIAAVKAEAEALKRHWKVDAAVSVNGKSGNTKEQNFSGMANAVLNGPDDELKLYSRYTRKSSDGDKTADERIGGYQYSSYFFNPLGWYVRTELEQDEFENIALRTTLAGGLTYRWANEKDYKLSGRTGLSYRHESYEDNTENSETMGLDFGLSHFYRFKNRWEVKNELTYAPSTEELANYLATQDSHLAIPVANSDWWKIRFGIRNDFNSQPEGGRDKLDTTWYGAMSISRE
jgi:hypothetical protein